MGRELTVLSEGVVIEDAAGSMDFVGATVVAEGSDTNDVTVTIAGLVRAAAGVPSGAPEATELPIAVDTTGGSGGVYYWSGSAWVKAASI